MAKRKRLGPIQAAAVSVEPVETHPGPFMAPIAQVASDAASAAALDDLAAEVTRARKEGRMIQKLPLEAVDASYLRRDRITATSEELSELIASIRDRGQQTPIEVVASDDGRYGLISGWRRLTALSQLYAETGDARFATVLAILRQPDSASDAYVAMVEENEIRLGLSYYERARITAMAVEEGVYDSDKTALQSLFSTASRAKRSKIKSFMTLYRNADDILRFPTAIPERLGLALAREMEDDEEHCQFLYSMLRGYGPDTAEAELEVLQRVLATFNRDKAQEQGGLEAIMAEVAPEELPQNKAPAPPQQPVTATPSLQPTALQPRALQPKTPGAMPAEDPWVASGDVGQMPVAADIEMRFGPRHLTLDGLGVTDRFRRDLAEWIATYKGE